MARAKNGQDKWPDHFSTNGFSNGSVRGLLERGFFGNETDLFAADPKAGVGD